MQRSAHYGVYRPRASLDNESGIVMSSVHYSNRQKGRQQAFPIYDAIKGSICRTLSSYILARDLRGGSFACEIHADVDRCAESNMALDHPSYHTSSLSCDSENLEDQENAAA